MIITDAFCNTQFFQSIHNLKYTIMKTLSIYAALFISLFTINFANGQAKHVKKEKATMTLQYSCPMHPDVKSDKPGKCTQCGMDLVKSKKESMKMETAKTTYCCPMHADVTSDKPGKCTKCGMDLKLSKKEQMKMQSMYKCPMHPDVTSDKNGKCPKCGMDLKKS
jgi:Cu(I)/Ag(I) efflux system membrane fusion protein